MKFKALYTLLALLSTLLVVALAAPAAMGATNDRSIVKQLDDEAALDNALNGRHIALWNSHGSYYNQIEGKWMWQRARLLGTVEDLYSTDYMLNYITPMLEKAGAYIFMPRERDLNTHEYIIDNDTPALTYHEWGKWNDGKKSGFAHKREVYEGFINPFEEGTYRWCKSVKGSPTHTITWDIPIAESGHYALYIAYSMVKNGATDARYTVHHAGGTTPYSVNQTMGGGTWIYLGSFDFVAGGDNRVTLTNESSVAGQLITADAIKVGGGMGNIARKPCFKPRKATKQALKNQKEKAKKRRKKQEKVQEKARIDEAVTSGMPRYAEAARYWMQWAGVPDTIYSDTGGDNDYGDDLRGRAYWVNYLCGGSKILPESDGLNIPIDMAFAFHSDAGNVPADSIIGSMGIYYSGKDRRGRYKRYENSVSRIQAERLNDFIMESIESDLTQSILPQWNIRKSLNRKYAEAYLLDVPCVLLESMSHQNYADMLYGHDPRFKFALSRAIYKGILKYLSHRHKRPYIVQPLPVQHMALQWHDKNDIEITWQATPDTLESSATPTHYKVYTRCGDYGWDKGTIVKESRYVAHIEGDKHYSFYVTALNAGGESFPSEILSGYRNTTSQHTVMIVNAFDRISAPYGFSDTAAHTAGFLHDIDAGVPYHHTVAYTGAQYNFDKESPWVDDLVNPGFGASNNEYEGTVVAGNTFDYPLVHGRSIAQLGYSYLSTSDEAVNDGTCRLSLYPIVDVILGKERATIFGNDSSRYDFEALPQPFTEALTRYCHNGGNLLISGAYIGQDACEGNMASAHAQTFLNEVLHSEWVSGRNAHKDATVHSIGPEYYLPTLSWNSRPNSRIYAVEQTDILYPADEQAVGFAQYENGDYAAIACINDNYRCCTLGFPIEVIDNAAHRHELFTLIFDFLHHK